MSDKLKTLGEPEPMRAANEYEVADHNHDLRKNHPLDDRRQPKVITVTVTGEAEDVRERFPEMYAWLNGRFANVDFSTQAGKVTFYAYPFAVND